MLLLITCLLSLYTEIAFSFQDIKHNCFVNADDISKIYSHYTTNNNIITIKIISSTNYKFGYNKFIDNFIQIMYNSTTMNTFLIKNYNYKGMTYSDVEIAKINATENFINGAKYLDEKNWEYLVDVQDTCFILTWEEDLLLSVVEGDWGSIFENPRTTYLIVLAHCVCKRDVFRNMLQSLWLNVNAIHAYIFVTCSLNRSTIFTYNPFKIHNGTRGYFEERAINEFMVKPPNKLSNFEGYPIKTRFFVRSPTAMRLEKSPLAIRENPVYKTFEGFLNFGGYDGYILASTAQYLNLTFNIVSIDENARYGTLEPNGTYSGILGDIVYKRLDIAGNGMFYTKYEASDLIEFTNPVNNDLICVVVPKAQKIPQWIKMFQCFQPKTWLFLFGIWILCVCFWLIIGKNPRVKRVTFLEIIAIFLTAPVKLSTKSAQRIFLASCMGFTVIITNIFQGSLVKSFSTDTYYSDLNTLEALDKSGLLIGTSLNVFNSDNSQLMKRLSSKIVQLNSSSLKRAARYRDVAAVERQQDANLLINTQFKKNDGYPLLHLINECPSSFFIAYIVPKGSPYVTRFSYAFSKFSQSGLLNKWYNDIFDALVLENLKKSYQSDDKKPFNLEDVQAAFYILIIGLLLALLTFAIETIC